MLLKGNIESADRVLVDEMEVERSEEAVVEESPKCLYQSSSEAEVLAKDREPNTNLRSCVAREARSQS